MQVTEGKAKITVNDGIFYNSKMKRLRDISVALLKSLDMKNPKVLDATAATGIRGIRYALECKCKNVTLIDANPKAVANIKSNLRKNKLRLNAKWESVQRFVNDEKEKFDVIDLDPFGTPVPFIYDLMKVSKDGTIFMITATDTATLCGAQKKACVRLYAAKPLNNEQCHEVGVRILISYIAKLAAQFNYGIEPVLAVAELHYMRVFLRLKHGADYAVESVRKCGMGMYCNKMHEFYLSENAFDNLRLSFKHNCGSDEIFGPLWLGNLYDKKVTGKMLKIAQENEERELIELIDNEYDTPLFYSTDKITEMLGIGSVSKSKVLNALNKNRIATNTQFERNGIKTDAKEKQVEHAVKLAR